ncbi:MAG: ArgE/DapE family deacylase, partial [Candidatus Aminicenantaceae bacterium]
YREQIITTLCDLISIPTENPPGQSYKECVDYLSSKLKELKIEHEVISVSRSTHPRFSIVGAQGRGEAMLHFHGHYDVVPAGSPEQFKPLVQEDFLYGRGSSDMKSGLVVILFMLRAIKELDLEIKGRITFSLVPDEETGGRLGTHYLFDSGFLPQDALGMLMPEPTSGVIWNANKGALTYKITVKGKSAHVGLEHQGNNAFERMVEVAHSFLKLKKDIQKRRTSLVVNPPGADRSVMLIGGESSSGFNFNVVPDRSFFTIDRRLNPEEKLVTAKREIIQVINKHKKKGVKLEVEVLQEGESSRVHSETHLGSILSQSVKEVTGTAPSFELCPGLCEIRFFNNNQIPAFAYGPGILEVSHGPDEYVKISDVLNCTLIYTLTALRILSNRR